MSTLVLGGGITGLLAAYNLQQKGEAVEVWEAAEAIGGWVQSLEWPDAEGRPGRVEKGPQGVLVAPGSSIERLFRELDLPVQSPGHGARWVGKGGRLIPVPSAPPALLFSSLMSLGTKLRLLKEPFVSIRDAEPEEGLAAFVARRLGPGIARDLLPAMVAGILAAPVETLSVDAIPKLRQWEAYGSLVKGMQAGGRSALMVPKGGMGSLPKAVAARLESVRTGLRATSLEPLEGRWKVQAEGAERLVDRVILALPAFEAAALLGPVAPGSAEALAAIPYTTVRLWNSRHRPLAPFKDGFGFLMHPPEGEGFLGSLVPSWIDPGCAPGGAMQLRTFVGGAFPTAPDLEAWEGVWRRLERWMPGLAAPQAVRLLEARNAIPRAEMGHRGRVTQALAGLPRGLDWISNARFGPGVRDVVEGLETWTGPV
jgi:oxygen-dependent protoporphyrinogen oxidase